MPKIVFWSPDAVSVGQTSALVAISTLMAIEEDYSNIILPGQWQSKKICSAFESYNMLVNKGVFSNSGVGITALARLVSSNKITSEAIRNYSKPVLKQRLDIMYGTNAGSRQEFGSLISKLPSIIDQANEAYDLVWVDLPKTLEKEYISDTIAKADIVVCTFGQDITMLNDYLSVIEEQEILKDKKKIILMCNYEEKSKFNIPNIKRMYGIKDEILCIPHNILFNDAVNSGDLVEGFFYKNILVDANDYNGYFIAETRKVVKKILSMIKL